MVKIHGHCLGPAASPHSAQLGCVTIDGEPWAKVTGVVYYGSKSSSQENDHLSEFDFGLPQYGFDAEFNVIEEKNLSRGHEHSSARCVCSDRFDIGRRFLSCPFEGYDACGYVKWLDDEWQGRARCLISNLVQDNEKLNKKVADLEGIISRQKQERSNHRQQIKARNKKELGCVLLIVVFAIFYALFAIMIRGFV